MASAADSKFNPKVIEEKCTKAGVSFWLASEVALALQAEVKRGISEEQLNDLVLKELEKRDGEAARAYENYHKVYVRTSDGVLESFNKEKIVSSLMRETTLAQAVCKEIAGEVESDIRRLELRYISAPLIREMVSSKLLERRYMQAKVEYTRLGLPIYDVTRMIEQTKGNAASNPEALHKMFGDTVAEEYALVKLLPEEVSKAHLSGLIHIHDLPYFATRPSSLQNDLRWFLRNGVVIDGIGKTTSVTGPAKHAEVAISHAIRVLISGETYLGGGVSFDFFNTLLAPYIIDKEDAEVSQLIQTFLYELNQICSVKGGRLAQSTLNFEVETPPFLRKEKAILPGGGTSQDTYQDYERQAQRLLTIFLDTMGRCDFSGKPFSMPGIVLKVRDGPIPPKLEKAILRFTENNDITILNMRNRKNGPNANMIAPNQILLGKGKWFSTLRTGVLQEVSINLPSIALVSKEDSEFFGLLDKALSAAKDACKIKKDIIEQRLHKDKLLAFLTQQFDNEEYYSLDAAPSVVNVIGLDNAVREYTGSEIIKSKDAMVFAEKVLAYINRKLESFNENEGTYLLFGNLDVTRAVKRFGALNEKRFGIREVYPRDGFTHTYPDVDKWLEVESALQAHCYGAAKLNIAGPHKDLKRAYGLLGNEHLVCFTLKSSS